MARRKFSINYPSFPEQINRDVFGHWLSGFTDGEGCFRLFYYPFEGRKIPASMFSIRLWADDKEALALIQSYWQCGGLQYNNRTYDEYHDRKPQWTYVVYRTEQLMNIIVPHFERYPLFAKKAHDFSIWKEGIALKYAVHMRPLTKSGRKGTQPKYTPAELERFALLVESLKQQRTYKENGQCEE